MQSVFRIAGTAGAASTKGLVGAKIGSLDYPSCLGILPRPH